MAVKAMLQEGCSHLNNKMYRLGPDVSTGFCGLHYVRRQAMLRVRLHEITQNAPPEVHTGSIDMLRTEVEHSIYSQSSQHDPATYTCVVHAFHLTGDPGYLQVAQFGLGTTFAGPYFIDFILSNNLLEARSQGTVVEDDLVLYFNDGTFTHIGRMIDSTRVVSKWGIGGLYEHGLWEVPATYGNDVRFFVGLNPDDCYELFVRYAETRGFCFG